ncbi:unnamed protein product [Trichobilharzia regenti]|nr:unnamed protein product [Trichobilharzia regenti]
MFILTIITTIYFVSGEDYLLMNEDLGKLGGLTTIQTTIDPVVLESYRKNTIKSFTIFGIIFGSMNVICWIASIIKAISDRKKIKKRNLARRKASMFKSESHRNTVLKDLIEPEKPVLTLPSIVDDVIQTKRQNTANTPKTPESPTIHHFSRCSSLRRSGSFKRSTVEIATPNSPSDVRYQSNEKDVSVNFVNPRV